MQIFQATKASSPDVSVSQFRGYNHGVSSTKSSMTLGGPIRLSPLSSISSAISSTINDSLPPSRAQRPIHLLLQIHCQIHPLLTHFHFPVQAPHFHFRILHLQIHFHFPAVQAPHFPQTSHYLIIK